MTKDNDGAVTGHAAGDTRGQAGLAQIAHAVDEPPGATGAEGTQDGLGLATTTDELSTPCDRDLTALRIQKFRYECLAAPGIRPVE